LLIRQFDNIRTAGGSWESLKAAAKSGEPGGDTAYSDYKFAVKAYKQLMVSNLCETRALK
jgi:hypothetical protein